MKTTNADAEDVEMNNTGNVQKYPLNYVSNHISLPIPGHYPEDFDTNFEERILKRVERMRKLGLIEKPWYHF